MASRFLLIIVAAAVFVVTLALSSWHEGLWERSAEPPDFGMVFDILADHRRLRLARLARAGQLGTVEILKHDVYACIVHVR